MKKAHRIVESENIDGFYTKTTQKGGFSKLCAKIKKDAIPTYSIFQHLSIINAQTLSRMSSLSGRMNIAQVKIGFFTGFKKIKQPRISFVLGYLRMIL
jgi:hypothetical protein